MKRYAGKKERKSDYFASKMNYNEAQQYKTVHDQRYSTNAVNATEDTYDFLKLSNIFSPQSCRG